MRVFFALATVVYFSALVESANLLRASEVPAEILNNPKYIVYETQPGFYEVESLESTGSNITLRANKDDITFYVFTSNNPHKGIPIKTSQVEDIKYLTGFNPHKETLIIIHGWKSSHQGSVNELIRTAALANRDINVIVIDWSPIASGLYLNAYRSVVSVGNFIGDFLIQLNNNLDHYLSMVTLVGHSLGAHIAGNAGARTLGLVNAIIGLDAAGPLFSESNINNRLDPTDGRYVHVIHTNDGILGFGIKMGHADYYPNGGKSQPGCGLDLAGSCSHSRAYEYFAESLWNYNFRALQCTSYESFANNVCSFTIESFLGGKPIDRWASGNYYLNTNSRSPFALG